MEYRYRVFGKVKSSFILRGMYFRIGDKIDTDIMQSELDFIKERCELDSVSDNQKKEAKNPVPTNQSKKTEKNNSEVRNETRSGTNKAKSKASV